MIKALLKKVLPRRVKNWLRRSARELVGSDFAAPSLQSRDEAVYQVFDQRASTVEQLCFDKASALEEKMDERHQALLERFDTVTAMLDRRWSELEAQHAAEMEKLFARVDALERSLSVGGGKILASPEAAVMDDTRYAQLQEESHDGARMSSDRRALYEGLLGGLPCPDARILDLGCGQGEFVEVANQARHVAVGVDHSATAVRKGVNRGLDLRNSDILEYLRNEADEAWDVITSLHVVEHMPFDALVETVREVYRVVRPGGAVVIDTPKIANLYTLSQYYFVDPTHEVPRHHALYEFVLRSAGFNRVFVEDLVGAGDSHKLDVAGFGDVVTDACSSGDFGEQMENVLKAIQERLSSLDDWLFVGRDVRIVAIRSAE